MKTSNVRLERTNAVTKAKHITVRRLPLINLQRKPFRTSTLAAVVAVLSFTIFGGSILARSLSNGLESMEQRLGADLIIVPAGSEENTESMLVSGQPTSFYFDIDIENAIAEIPGVAAVTSQTYISSLDAACCEEEVQIIGYDPESDFVIQAWIAEMNLEEINAGQMIVGANIEVSDDNTVLFFDHDYPVAGKLAKTGTSMDNSVFLTQDSIPELVEYANQVGAEVMSAEYAGVAISSILVEAMEGISPEEIAYQVTQAQIYGVSYVYPDGVTQTTGQALQSLVTYLLIFAAVLWVVALIVALAVFSASVNERKKELASLQILGMTRLRVAKMILAESSLIGIIGGLVGIVVAALLVFPFSTVISDKLQLPYLLPDLGDILLLGMGAIIFALFTTLLAGSVSVRKVSQSEVILTLREGE